MILAEIEAVLDDRDFDINDHGIVSRAVYTTYFNFTLLVGLIVFGWPEAHPELDPWLGWLIPLTPSIYTDVRRFWETLAAVHIVWCAFRLKWVQRVFTTKTSLYLGDISYALYIVHMRIVLSVGQKVHWQTDRAWGENRAELGQIGFFFSNASEFMVLIPLAIWEADLFWRVVDQPVVRLGKYVEQIFRVPGNDIEREGGNKSS
jgi:peptidoglycan/LPS O-acetylase OafA/YrhL